MDRSGEGIGRKGLRSGCLLLQVKVLEWAKANLVGLTHCLIACLDRFGVEQPTGSPHRFTIYALQGALWCWL